MLPLPLRAIRSLLARSKICPVKSPPELVTLIASVDDPAIWPTSSLAISASNSQSLEPHLGRMVNYVIDRAEGVSIRREPPGERYMCRSYRTE